MGGTYIELVVKFLELYIEVVGEPPEEIPSAEFALKLEIEFFKWVKEMRPTYPKKSIPELREIHMWMED